MPGGETKVCLRFDRICAGGEDAFFLCCDESSSECALSRGDGGVEVGCKITPTPNLLAEPSRPIAIGMLELCLVCSIMVIQLTQLIQIQKLNFLFRDVAAKACEHRHEGSEVKPAGGRSAEPRSRILGSSDFAFVLGFLAGRVV